MVGNALELTHPTGVTRLKLWISILLYWSVTTLRPPVIYSTILAVSRHYE